MASGKQKKKTAASRNTAKYHAENARRQKNKKPIRREVGAGVCILLCLITIAAWIRAETPVLSLFFVLFKGLVGSGFYILPVSFLLGFFILLWHDGRPVALRVICAFMLSVLLGAIVHLFADSMESWGSGMLSALWNDGIDTASGGVIGGMLGQAIALLVGKAIAVILLIIGFLFALITSLNMTIPGIIRAIRERPAYEPPKKEHPDPAETLVRQISEQQTRRAERKVARKSDIDIPVDDPPLAVEEKPKKKTTTPSEQTQEVVAEYVREMGEKTKPGEQVQIPENEPEIVVPPEEKIKKEDITKERMIIEQQIEQQEQAPVYRYPPMNLLAAGKGGRIDGTAEMRQNAERLNDTLASFNVEANIINVTRGPSVTRYELELSRGTKLSKITNLADDIALSLGASGVRIAAIPDKISVVGIEVPNRAVATVYARDVIDSEAFTKSKSKISFAVGKDIGGNEIVGDIGKLPHMLIAGTTGSGKSVCMNSLIISLLYKAQPSEVKLIMIDPKMVELGVYNGIPHLLIPVVTDPKKAAGALQWAVTEMMRRYSQMADAGVRDVDSYNKQAESQQEEKLPRIVVVIDELADLMLVAAKEVEESICRVAQMGRAAGIHLVIATQRPSADVITGLMKANIPSRIAFAVASAMESRIILDTAGAEKLVGKGDMLYSPLGQGKPKRVQGCFISEEEVEAVVAFVKKDGQANYSQDIMKEIDRKAEQSGKASGNAAGAEPAADSDASDGDEMTPAAVEVLLETQQASVSMLQRRLKLGYARAARIMDELEEKGIVGPFEGSKPRQILITREEWELRKGGAGEDFNQEVPEEIE